MASARTHVWAWVAALVATARIAQADITAEEVNAAIDRGTAFLLREQEADGSWGDPPGYPGGVSALATLSLLESGLPADHPQIEKALEYLRPMRPDKTYSTALRTMVFSKAGLARDALLIQGNVKWLEEKQHRDDGRKGSWGYPEAGADNSNTQFALLALHEAQRAGAQTSASAWQLALDHFRGSQNPDGSWGYHAGDPGSGSMTCAGIAAVVMALDKLQSGDAEVEGDRVRCCGARQDETTIDSALTWLGRNFSVQRNPGGQDAWLLYYLYSVERAGRLSNRRFIGQHDWYRTGAETLVRRQDQLAGFWRGAGAVENDPVLATSYSLLFLAKGRRPVVLAKLQHGPGEDWNHHRLDAANLVEFVEREWERPLTWQVINIDGATAEDLIEAPVLFISGEAAVELSDEQAQTLRQYVNLGGFIFADAACSGGDFDAGFRRLVKRMFPEPDYDLRLLPPEHPIWSAEMRVDPDQVRPLWGVDVGCRTSVVYSPNDGRPSLSCLWELARPGRSDKYSPSVQAQINGALAIGVNVLAYATNREPKFKLEGVLALDRGPADAISRAKLAIAKVRHPGGWDVAPGALRNLLALISREAGVRVETDKREVTLADEQVFQYPILFMHGRNAFQLSDAERAQLRTFVERGGLLMADAVCASPEFARSFRREMAEVFPDSSLARIPADDPLFSSQFGGFDLKKVSRRDPRRGGGAGGQRSQVREVEPELEGVKVDDRYGVIFSPYDLSCALERQESLECAGYVHDDAARIGLNIVLYALHR